MRFLELQSALQKLALLHKDELLETVGKANKAQNKAGKVVKNIIRIATEAYQRFWPKGHATDASLSPEDGSPGPATSPPDASSEADLELLELSSQLLRYKGSKDAFGIFPSHMVKEDADPSDYWRLMREVSLSHC